MKINVLFGAIAASVIGIASASAADLPARKTAPAPVLAPMMTWTGFYVGLNAGYGWSQNAAIRTSATPVFVDPALPGAFANVPFAALLGANASLPTSKGAFIGGGQVGFNFQIAPSLVAGVEADIQGLASSGSNGAAATVVGVDAPPGPAGRLYTSALAGSQKVDYFGTLRARIGVLATPSMLLYATGGLAYGHVSTSASIVQVITSPPGPAILPAMGGGSLSATRLGWALGAGGEWKFASNWSAKLEYLYYDLGSVTNQFALTQFGPPGPALQFVNVINARSRVNGHVVRVGLNYHFGWGTGPVVAKY